MRGGDGHSGRFFHYRLTNDRDMIIYRSLKLYILFFNMMDSMEDLKSQRNINGQCLKGIY